MSIIPEKLNDFRVYVSGKSDLKGVADLQLPSLEYLTETVNGAGILGEYESPAYGHFQSMKFAINWRVTSDELLDFYKPEAITVDCRLANQEYDAIKGKHHFKPNRVLVHGLATKNDLGKVQKGSPYESSTEIEVLYMKVEREGKVLLEIDKINYIFIVDDVDYSARLREALGMA